MSNRKTRQRFNYLSGMRVGPCVMQGMTVFGQITIKVKGKGVPYLIYCDGNRADDLWLLRHSMMQVAYAISLE